MPLLEVNNLTIRLNTPRGEITAVHDLSFSLPLAGTLGLIGESGCGKSMTALALMGLLPPQATASGSIRLKGKELIGMPERALCQIRGNRIGMVFQEPMTALNPLQTIGNQVAEPLRWHQGLSARKALNLAIDLLERVGISNPAQRVKNYPHQFSGGQRQRITIAMALACSPDLLIADEPTTALDVTVQHQILQLIHELVAERSMGLLLISHDLGIIAQYVKHTLVMYGGTIVEQGATAHIFAQRAHPYTRALIAARPQLQTQAGTRPRLPEIAGSVQPQLAPLRGCIFASRCPVVQEKCQQNTPHLQTISAHVNHASHEFSAPILHQARCLRLNELAPNANLTNHLTPAPPP